ncbi:MAG: cupin domain-containing protein [Rhodoferax sp.]
MRRKLLLTFRMFPALLLPIFWGCATAPQPAPPAADQKPIVVQKLVQSTKSWDGAPLPAYPTTQPEVTILRISIAPGAKLPFHHHPVINAGVLLKGQLTVVTVNGATLHLKAGDPIVETVNMVHYGVNDGPVPAEIIVVYAGTPDHPITVIDKP